jgi:probable phosphoglycerate mutase
MLIYCVRHGESAYNAEGRIQGQSNVPLSSLGLRQAQALLHALAPLPIEAVYASPLSRAMETARPIAEALKLSIQTDERLMEINAGVFQDRLRSELADAFPQEYSKWKSPDPDFRIPGGESRRDLMVRSKAAFEAIHAAGHQKVLVVAHGGSLTAAFKGLVGVPAERNPFSLYNGSISTLRWESDVQLLTLNQIDHLRVGGIELETRTGDL